MTVRITWTAAVMLLLCGVGKANAQDNPRIGLTMGYPTGVGVLWHVTDRIAIRPEIDFSRFTVASEGTSPLGSLDDDETTSHVIRPAVSALFYLTRRDELRTYVTPRFAYIATDTSSSTDSSTYLVSGSFGAHQRLGNHFAVFGELGIEYSRAKTQISLFPDFSATTRRTGIGTRSGVGVVLYF